MHVEQAANGGRLSVEKRAERVAGGVWEPFGAEDLLGHERIDLELVEHVDSRPRLGSVVRAKPFSEGDCGATDEGASVDDGADPREVFAREPVEQTALLERQHRHRFRDCRWKLH